MNPVLLDFPDSFNTERLTIRAPRQGDGAEIAQAVHESLNDLRPWMPWAKEEPSAEQQESRIRKGLADWLTRTNLLLHLYLTGTGAFVGGSGLHRFDWRVRKFEIGYWVRTKFAGQGYITEAVNGITAFAFTHLHANRVEIRCDAKNVRSAAVARRCGFLLEGVLRNEALSVDGELRDTLVFSKINPTEFHRG
ncbi:MAG TPA: GNAT family N-acetyltransferase [Anaerolineae bacterium]|nr:GNAT family N-acetyltransferase [Anaerolineae bacterium]